MTEIPLHTIHLAEGSETSRLWKMMKKPQTLQRAIKDKSYSRPVEVCKTHIESNVTNGRVSTHITPEGNYRIEVGYREGREQEPTTYTEETLHLLQELLNPMYFEQTEKEDRAKKQLTEFGIDDLPSGLASMYSSSFLQNVEQSLLSFADNVGFTSLCDHFLSERALLIRFFTLSLKSPGLHMSTSTLIKLAGVTEKWGFTLLTEEEKQFFLDEEQLMISHVQQMRSLPENSSFEEMRALNDAQIAEREPLKTKVATSIEQIAQKLEELSEEEVKKLFVQLGLQPVLTVENYTIAREHFLKSDPTKTRECIVNYITNADSIRLEKVHYLLRPGAYSDYKIDTDDWLNTLDDDNRRLQSLERINQYSDSALPKFLIQLIDEELSQLWVEGAAEHAAITHPMFWDVAQDSSLPTNPEYIQRNVEAIRVALASGEVKLPALLVKASQAKGNDFRLLPQEVAKQNDPYAASLVDEINDIQRARRMSRFDTWEVLGSKVRSYIKVGIELLIQNPTVPSLQYLIDRLVGISYMMHEYSSLNTMNCFMAELVAKSIKMYLLGNKEELGDMYAGNYTFLLTSQKPEIHTRPIGPGVSIWQGLVDKIIEVLQTAEDDGKIILTLLQATTIQEVAEIVQYDLG